MRFKSKPISTAFTLLAIMLALPAQVAQAAAAQAAEPPKIQIAILLDTSNSMDGLIDQTRNQLWQVVNEFSNAKQNGITPVLEIALFEYGNDNNSPGAGYVRRLNAFTRELDRVSGGLFSLTTSGGDEFCGFAIQSAVEQLQWSHSDSDIKTIFIAGNEPFTQGPVDYRRAIEMASRFGISVNTIHAGAYQEGINEGWQTGAMLAGGNYMSIDADQQVVHLDAPQDPRIAELNALLNQTYLPFGAGGADSLELQMEQDALSSDISAGLLAKRAKSKSTSFYDNSSWDLIDAIANGAVGESEIMQMDEESLPRPMAGMPSEERLAYVREKAEQRKRIQQEIGKLSRLRDVYVAEKRRNLAAAAPSVSDALTEAVKKEARRKNFVFQN